MQIDFKGLGTAAFSVGIEPSGREHAIVVIKRALAFPQEDGGVCTWSTGQVPLVMADEFTGEPGFSACVREADFPLRKPKCDVILTGFAHTPGGRPMERLRVGMAIGPVAKAIDVVGNRHWESVLMSAEPSEPEPFTSMPISYDYAFGGVDDTDPDEELAPAYLPNPVGRGWFKYRSRGLIEGRPLPNCESPGEETEVPWEDYTPASFGPIGRGWPERVAYAGTYDEEWVADVFPFLPDDFDERYYQCAPEDQRIPHPVGGEEIKLQHLTPDAPPLVTMTLPRLDIPVVFAHRSRGDVEINAVTDTIEIEPELRRISVVSRASIPLDRDLFEIREMIVGKRPKGFWRARRLGKSYRPLGGIGQSPAEDDE